MKNLKLLVFLFTLLFVAEKMEAQTAFGPKMGLTLATLDVEELNPGDEYSHIMGVQFGLVSQFNINERFSIQPEVLYFQKGVHSKVILPSPASASFYLNYIEIPLLLNIKFNPGDKLVLFSTLGPSLSFGINGKIKSYNQVLNIQFGDFGYTKRDFSLSLGMGAQYQVGKGTVFFDARYLLGFRSILETEKPYLKNRVINLSAGLKLPIGRGI